MARDLLVSATMRATSLGWQSTNQTLPLIIYTSLPLKKSINNALFCILQILMKSVRNIMYIVLRSSFTIKFLVIFVDLWYKNHFNIIQYIIL